jgi:hypothetical protein
MDWGQRVFGWLEMGEGRGLRDGPVGLLWADRKVLGANK